MKIAIALGVALLTLSTISTKAETLKCRPGESVDVCKAKSAGRIRCMDWCAKCAVSGPSGMSRCHDTCNRTGNRWVSGSCAVRGNG